MMYVRFLLSLRNVEDLLFERGIDICHETVRLWWNRFGPLFASDSRRQRVSRMKGLAMHDVLIRGGIVFDGSGGPGCTADNFAQLAGRNSK